ncbi:MAG: DPP IV N-terminal domain-containing protein [Planctomycetota bacterium]|nr:DPP IV N-terminal domain-containing protein [Planctomycetota bacterium]MDA1211861.1 DPP IV N-terminal domain-containing protein [Planctomycetota bacterium]
MPHLPTTSCILFLALTTIVGAQDDLLTKNKKPITADGDFKQRPAWSPDGKQLLFSRHDEQGIFLYHCSPDGNNDQRLIDETTFHFNAVFSPDGKRIAYEHDKLSPGQGDMELYLADADGKNPQPLFVTEGRLSHEEWPSWSPDGKTIVCTSTRDANTELYLLSFPSSDDDTGAEPKRLTSDPAIDDHPCFSPDGQSIAFATNRWGDLEIALYDLATGTVTRLTTSPGLDDYPAWSPDGKQIAFTSNRDGNLEIYVMNADGSGAKNITQHAGPDNFPTWSPDGALTFVSLQNGGWDIYRIAK